MKIWRVQWSVVINDSADSLTIRCIPNRNLRCIRTHTDEIQISSSWACVHHMRSESKRDTQRQRHNNTLISRAIWILSKQRFHRELVIELDTDTSKPCRMHYNQTSKPIIMWITRWGLGICFRGSYIKECKYVMCGVDPQTLWVWFQVVTLLPLSKALNLACL